MPADADEARRAAEEVLAGSEYRQPGEAWFTTVLRKLDEWFSELLGGLGGAGGGSWLSWLVVVAVGTAAVVAVVLAVRSVRRGRRAGPEPDGPAVTRRRREAELDWEREAARLEAEGAWREGLRARYRSLVSDLARRRVVDTDAALTTGEHRREVGDRAPEVAGEFAAAAELFDRAWYGNRPTGPEEARRFGDLARRVEEGAR